MKQDNFSFIKSKKRLSAELTDTITRKTNLALIALGYSQAYVGLIASLFCATVILIGLYSMPKNQVLIAWYIFFLLQTVFRCVIVAWHNSNKKLEKNSRMWSNLFILGAFLGGLAW